MSKRARKRNRNKRTVERPQSSGVNVATTYEWVSVEEERDSQGRPHMPKDVMESTAPLRYDPNIHTDMDFHIRTGAGPAGELIGQYKLYPISKFDMRGRKLTAMATIDLPIWRQHEEAWFQAFQGVSVRISEPGIAGAISKEYHLNVTGVRFDKKVSRRSNEYSLEACITMNETIRSAAGRHKVAVILIVSGAILTSVVGAVIGSIVNRML